MTKNIGKYIMVGVIVLFLLVFMFKIYIVVDPGEKAVIFNKATGNLRVTPNEGFYFLIPLIEEPTIYDMKARTYTMSIATLEGEIKGDDSLQALTSDGQTVLLDISVRYHPDVDNLDKLHRRIGVDYVNKVLRPQVRSHRAHDRVGIPGARRLFGQAHAHPVRDREKTERFAQKELYHLRRGAAAQRPVLRAISSRPSRTSRSPSRKPSA